MATYTEIASVTVGSGGAGYVEFTSIPSTYTDLKIVYSLRDNQASVSRDANISFNGSTTNYSELMLFGGGNSVGSYTASGSYFNWGVADGASATSNTFSNGEIYIPNYAGSTYKSVSGNGVTENNGVNAYAELNAYLWSNTSAITSIKITTAGGTGSFVQYSTAYLYGIKKD